MTIRYVPGPKNVADSLSRGPLPIDWAEFQQQPALDDPDIGIGLVAMFQELGAPSLLAPVTRQGISPGISYPTGPRAAAGEHDVTAPEPAPDCVPPETAGGKPARDVTAPGSSRGGGQPSAECDATAPGSARGGGAQGAEGGNDQSFPDIVQLQRQDPLWQPLIEILSGKRVKVGRRIWKDLPDYALDDDGVLKYQPKDSTPRTVVPRALVPQLIKESHCHPLAGHYRARAVLHRLKNRFFWPSMSTDIKEFCASCVKCHGAKVNRRDQPAQLGIASVTYGPWETLHTDLVGPRPETAAGHRWILLIVCAFTKFVELIPLRDSTADTVAQGLVATFHRYGLPSRIVSDNGSQYRSDLLAKVNALLDVRHIFISAYHAQANANVERMCGTVKAMLATALNRTQREWDRFLGASQYAANSSLQTTNRYSPAFLMFGRHFRLPIEKVLSEEPSPYSAELGDLVTELKERQFDAFTHVIESQETARKYQRDWYNRRAKEKGFKIGDRVYVFHPAVKPGHAAKLTRKWQPGYVVEACHSNGLTYQVRQPETRKPPETVHVNRLKPMPLSHVYREGLEPAKGIRGRHAIMPQNPISSAPVPASPRRKGGGDRSSSDWEWPGGIPSNPPPEPEPRPDSGITAALEAAASSTCISSSNEDNGDSSSEDDFYESIEQAKPVGLRRTQRARRPPARYSPAQMAAKFFQWFGSDPRIAQYCIGTASGCIFGGYLLPHGLFLDKYKRFVQAYKEGLPVRLGPQQTRHVDAVLDDAAVDAEERSRLRFFAAFGADPFHAGSTGLRWGAVVGLPQTFALTQPEELAKSGFAVGGKKVDWRSREGTLLSDGLRLSPAAQRFAIARELWHVRSSYVYQDGGLAATAFLMTYLLGRTLNHKMGFAERPRTLRVMMYTLVTLFGVAVWITVKDLVQHYRDSKSDMAAAELGAAYAWGGVEFYEKVLERNRALRRLLGEDGESMYSAYGNELTLLRQPRMPITERLETLRAYCERQHPRHQLGGASEDGTLPAAAEAPPLEAPPAS